jgi:hypothetical protein
MLSEVTNEQVHDELRMDLDRWARGCTADAGRRVTCRVDDCLPPTWPSVMRLAGDWWCGTCSPRPASSVTPSARSLTSSRASPRLCTRAGGKAPSEMRDTPDRDHAGRVIEVFAPDCASKRLKAAAKGTYDAEKFSCSFDKAADLVMASKPVEAPPDRWRAVNGLHPVAPVRAGTRFESDVLVEWPSASGQASA